MTNKLDDLEKAKLIYETSKERLESSLSNSDALLKKIFFLTGIYITGITTTAGFVVKGNSDVLIIIAFFGLLYAFVILTFSLKTKKYASRGFEAKSLINDEYSKMTLSVFYQSIALGYDEKASHNNLVSSDKASYINRSIKCTAITSVILVTIKICLLLASRLAV